MNYPKDIDKECIDLCDALNALPGIKTTESCCGHCMQRFLIFFECTDFKSLSILARAFDRRYSGTDVLWEITAETCDSQPNNQFMASSLIPYNTAEQMKKDTENLCYNIKYWSSRIFEDYFKDLSK